MYRGRQALVMNQRCGDQEPERSREESTDSSNFPFITKGKVI
jgi:hypothetical protein